MCLLTLPTVKHTVTLYGNASTQVSVSFNQMVLENLKKYYCLSKRLTPIVVPYPHGSRFEPTRIKPSRGCFHTTSGFLKSILRGRFFLNAILFNISWISPIEKGRYLNKLECKSAFVTSLVEIGPVILVKKSKLERFTGRRPDRQTDTGKVHLSFMLRWVKKLRKQQTYLGFSVKHNQLKYFF